MRAAMEVFARRCWDGEDGARGWLLRGLALPVSWGWSGAARVMGALRARGSVDIEDIAVVSVGNLAVGGTGKTPLVAWIAQRLGERGERPAVVVGGAARDEAALHASRAPGIAVLQARDRIGSVVEARGGGASVAILDDGFQHRRLGRDLDIVLLAAEDRFPGPVLPAGPYRESPSALARADTILVTRRLASLEASRALAARVEAYGPDGVLGGLELALSGWRRLRGEPSGPPDTDVVAACAIARPEGFRSTVALRVRGSVELVAFADHHEYTPGDVEELVERCMGRPLVITEKDAVKLSAHADTLGEAYVLCEEVRWDWGEHAFEARLSAAVEGARRR